MPNTTTDPTTITVSGGHFIGAAHMRPIDTSIRVIAALNDRLNGMTWREIANLHGYRSAAVAEHNVGRYVAWLNGQRVQRQVGRRVVPGMSLRSFGVEIEFSGCTMARAARAVSDALGEGRTVGVNGYHSSTRFDEWRMERDGSVTTNRGMGGECISPVLSGPEGLAEVEKVVAAIRAAGGRVDRRCGIHVHIDARDMTGEQIARLFVAYVDRQDAFDALVSPSRRGNYYCYRYGQDEKNRVETSLKDRRYGGSERYRSVNVTQIGGARNLGTVEFRQHHGSLNGTKVTSWIKLLLALSQSVMDAADEHLPFDCGEMIDALKSHGLDDRAARHLTNRIAA